MMPSERSLRRICLLLLVLCAPFAGACRQQEQEQRRAFVEFLETQVMAAASADRVRMSGEIRKKIGNYGKHFDVIATYSKELGDINARLAGEKTRIAAHGPVAMDRLGSERARMEQIVAVFSRSAQQVDAVKARADAAKTALKQPEDVQAAFDRVYEKEVSGYAATIQALYAVQKDFYAAAVRMGVFLDKHREKIHFRNKTVTIDEQALLTEYNALQQSLQEKSRTMQAALASGRSAAR
jgi:chaperonin cofactor prefoldin